MIINESLPHIDIGSRRIEYSVVRAPRGRYTYFRFRSDQTLEVSVPKGWNVDIEALIREKLTWIDREYARAANSKRILAPEGVMYDGRYLRLIHIEDIREGLTTNINAGEVVVRSIGQWRTKELIRRWFLKETSSYVIRKIHEVAPSLGTKPSRVDVREITKWGYCTRDGRLSFCWQLIALPERLREYVVLHELVHLLEFNHSPAFKKRLASVCPGFRMRERELAQFVPYDKKSLW